MLPLLEPSISNISAGFHFKLQFRTKKQHEKPSQYQTNPAQVCTLPSPTLWRLSFFPQPHGKVKAPPHQIHVLAGWDRDLLLVMGRMDWEERQWHKVMVTYTDLCKLSRDGYTKVISFPREWCTWRVLHLRDLIPGLMQKVVVSLSWFPLNCYGPPEFSDDLQYLGKVAQVSLSPPLK